MIQNYIIKSMAYETVQLIPYEIKLAQYFPINDSTLDINTNDQFSLNLRFVDQGKIREHFICFENCWVPLLIIILIF